MSATDSLLGALGVAVVGGVTLNLLDRFNKQTGSPNKWFNPKVNMDWHKDMPMGERRQNALDAHNGDPLATGRALQALSNVTTDPKTKIESLKDAKYFFRQNRLEGKVR